MPEILLAIDGCTQLDRLLPAALLLASEQHSAPAGGVCSGQRSAAGSRSAVYARSRRKLRSLLSADGEFDREAHAAYCREYAATAGGSGRTPAVALGIPYLRWQHLTNHDRSEGRCRSSWLERDLVGGQNINRSVDKEDIGQSDDHGC